MFRTRRARKGKIVEIPLLVDRSGRPVVYASVKAGSVHEVDVVTRESTSIIPSAHDINPRHWRYRWKANLLLGTITGEGRIIIGMLHGIGFKRRSLAQIANDLHITRDRVCRIDFRFKRLLSRLSFFRVLRMHMYHSTERIPTRDWP